MNEPTEQTPVDINALALAAFRETHAGLLASCQELSRTFDCVRALDEQATKPEDIQALKLLLMRVIVKLQE
ncbi:hypothetical protein [Schlesneria paludicola]|uniref:hypothetical protein n=1 Tax=Schlesneria paludicola TaxID=360056 RepID=UPI00029A6D99|nr:hypothetical protein [Schlesneria paludicola]